MTKLASLAALALLLATSPAQAAFHMFRIQEIFTNGDGSVQFVVRRECCNTDGDNFLNGVPLRVTEGGATRVFSFPSNLPSGDTSGKSVLIATQGFANL